MQITGYTTQSSLIRLWTYTSSLFSPKPSAGDATERKRSNGSWKLIYRLRNPFKESSVWVPVCTADSSQRERTGNHRGKAGMERPSFPLPLLPWGRSLEAGKQQCPLSGWHWSMPPPSRVKRQRGSWKGKGIWGCSGWQMGRGNQWWAGGAGGNIKPRP